MQKIMQKGKKLFDQRKSYKGSPDVIHKRERKIYTYDPQASVMVAAIDFGTSHSGYAFSLKNKPEDVHMSRAWGHSSGDMATKTPTSVLVDKHDNFVAFGHEAEERYAKYCMDDKQDDYELYRQFKMMLYKDKKLNRYTRISSLRGTQHRALDIFAMAIEFLKDHLLSTMEAKSISGLDESRIQWVLTIPAIWTDQAKQFMREAVLQAGLIQDLYSEQLMFALEPEAAAVLCHRLNIDNFAGISEQVTGNIFPAGTKYMIIDAGGGTVDMAAHEITEEGDMIELMCVTGGGWGGLKVNKNFEQLLKEVFGCSFMEAFKADCPLNWFNLNIDFEIKKRAVNVLENTEIRIQLSHAIAQKCTEMRGIDIEQIIKSFPDQGISFKDGSLILSAGKVQSLFDEPTSDIVLHVSQQLNKDNLKGLNYILLVGGFGDSKFLFERLQSEFSRVCPVLCPHSAGLSAVKGAVMFGHRPQVITARRARKTYGTKCVNLFIEGQHDPAKMVIDEDGEKRCKGLFRVYVTKDELIHVNSCKIFTSYPPSSSHTSALVLIYSTDSVAPLYIDDPGVTLEGEFRINLPLVPGKSRRERPVEHRVYFGQTEIKVEIEDKSREGGEVVSAHIDFLGN